MVSRKDHLHSYQFLVQRSISAFVMRETDPAQSPLRRGIGAVFAGLMVAVLVAAGFGIYGLITKMGGGEWRYEGAVVIERETGASFVYLNDQLHPTLNYSSALLAAASATTRVNRVAHDALESVPRGVTIGIRDAPDALPGAADAVGLPWSICAMPSGSRSGARTSAVTLVVGTAPVGAEPVGPAHGLLVRLGTAGSRYLIWRGHRHQLAEAVVPALFGAMATPIRVEEAWLNSLPAGSPIGPIAIEDRGSPSQAMPGRRVGDVLVAQTGSGPQHYVVFDDGLAPISRLQVDLLAADSAARPTSITVSTATKLPRSSQLPAASGSAPPPQQAPKLVVPAADAMVCATTVDGRAAPQFSAGGWIPQLDVSTTTTITATPGGTSAGQADRVAVPSGRVAVIRVLASPTARTGSYSIVTDLGLRFPVPSADVLRYLGYDPATAVDVPAALAQRLPIGPTLDPVKATQPA